MLTRLRSPSRGGGGSSLRGPLGLAAVLAVVAGGMQLVRTTGPATAEAAAPGDDPATCGYVDLTRVDTPTPGCLLGELRAAHAAGEASRLHPLISGAVTPIERERLERNLGRLVALPELRLRLDSVDAPRWLAAGPMAFVVVRDPSGDYRLRVASPAPSQSSDARAAARRQQSS